MVKPHKSYIHQIKNMKSYKNGLILTSNKNLEKK